jgi:Fic family protein
VEQGLLEIVGQGKGSKYQLSKTYSLIYPIDMDEYFQKEIDEREINKQYNHNLVRDVLMKIDLFTPQEIDQLNLLQDQYKKKIAGLSDREYKMDVERFAIDLSWKSSQIEGNTYSLLETEQLLKEKQTAAGKTKDEAVMLLNHKTAIDFLFKHQDYLIPLSISGIEDIQAMLVNELQIDRNIRTRTIGITGTNYRPLDNSFQIREALHDMCLAVNHQQNVFAKALLVLLLISYIQPFADGNKRTARIVCNGILINFNYCPMSFRTVDALDYKKAMLIFYEQNNISAFKEIFIKQFEFATKNYF